VTRQLVIRITGNYSDSDFADIRAELEDLVLEDAFKRSHNIKTITLEELPYNAH
jgi:hypothetical protein